MIVHYACTCMCAAQFVNKGEKCIGGAKLQWEPIAEITIK